MKYTVGYLGSNEFIEEQLSKYYNPGEEDKIRYINLSDISEDMIAATSFNGIIFDTSAHNIPEQNELIEKIITSNAEIDVMPILNKDKDNTRDKSSSELLEEIRLIKENYNISSPPCLVSSEEDAQIFIEGIFSTLSEKTIRHMEKIHQYMLNSKKNIMNVIDKFAYLLELKDPYTEGHSLRVANYAKQIAIKSGLSENEVEAVYQAGKLHDIGKIAIIDPVLKKEDKLNDKEIPHMKRHAVLGSILLDNILEPNEFEDVKKGVKHHHEKYDGFGYPDGISGENIPLIARILCIADSFDAMTTKRVYTKGNPKTLSEAIDDLTRNAGKQFDPNIVEIFIDLLKNEPEKLDIDIENDVVKVKYASNQEKRSEEEHAKANKQQEIQANIIDEDR